MRSAGRRREWTGRHAVAAPQAAGVGAGAVGHPPLPDDEPSVSGELWHPAYIGVGSNLDDPRAQLLHAFAELAELARTRVILTSPLYVSRPLGPAEQPDYVNAVVGLLTQLEPPALLAGLQAIELTQGRPVQRERWGPRVIDLDILVYGRERRADAHLTVPHPGIVERNFVLYPLAEITPDLEIPGLGRVAQLAGRIAPEGLRALNP